MSNRITNANLKATCETVLYGKSIGQKKTVVNGVTFDDNMYDGKGGRCQENSRKAYEATTGKPMPGKACCAGKTWRNLEKHYASLKVASKPYSAKKFAIGDYLFFDGGTVCHTCGNPVGHVGIFMGYTKDGKVRMFQHTSRDGLGITQAGPTAGQKKRFVAAFRLLPIV